MKLTASFILLIVAATQAVPWNKLKVHYSNQHGTSLNSRIIGGSVATHHQFPYQVGIFTDLSATFCGGSLISGTVVLTSAQCTNRNRNFVVHLGAQSINNDNEVDRIIIETSNAIQHAAFDVDTLDNNIAIIMIPGPVSGNGIDIVRLPAYSQQSNTFTGQAVRVTGWGRNSDLSPNIYPELKYVDLTVMDSEACKLYYGDLLITAGAMCTDSMGGTVGICDGDDGGPMVFYEADTIPTQIGIVSFRNPAGCETGAPSVYTRVTTHLAWLEFNAGVTIRP